jgi:L-phenylalanine/L-methionine N-acetyltransferase
MPAPEGLELRAVRADDAEALATLQNTPGFRHGTLRLPYTTPESVRRWIEARGPGGLSLVGMLDGRLVASGGLSRFDGRRAHVANLGMGVHDDFAGRGIGTALLVAILDAADNWLAIRRIELTVYTDNARAIALYERHGFAREGVHRQDAFRAGEYVDSLAMARLRGV